MIRMIVGRCHVSESNRTVIRYVLSRMKKGAWRKHDRAMRKDILRQIVAVHTENRELYRDVMSGTI